MGRCAAFLLAWRCARTDLNVLVIFGCGVMTESSIGALLLAGILRLGGEVYAALSACAHHHVPQLPDPVRLPLAVQQRGVRFLHFLLLLLFPATMAMLHASCDDLEQSPCLLSTSSHL